MCVAGHRSHRTPNRHTVLRDPQDALCPYVSPQCRALARRRRRRLTHPSIPTVRPHWCCFARSSFASSPPKTFCTRSSVGPALPTQRSGVYGGGTRISPSTTSQKPKGPAGGADFSVFSIHSHGIVLFMASKMRCCPTVMRLHTRSSSSFAFAIARSSRMRIAATLTSGSGGFSGASAAGGGRPSRTSISRTTLVFITRYVALRSDPLRCSSTSAAVIESYVKITPTCVSPSEVFTLARRPM
mmetsp:Transcript_14938/g.38016  ORF Transcript_14938/g.38016 Transcript_14938/m.38016 type:complete len:242 (+) Transcript_14938:128-853(+)